MISIHIPLTTSEEHPCSIKRYHDSHDHEAFSWDDVPSFMPANHFFTLGKVLGSGTSARVHEATHPLFGKCAVKAFRRQYWFAAEDEINFLKRVQGHPHFPCVYDTWNNGNDWFIAMELMNGTLFDLMGDTPMAIEQVSEVTNQIATALHFLHHTAKLVHFDLKPENIGYVSHPDGSMTYKILDLGAAEYLSTVQSLRFQEEIATGQVVKTSKWYRANETLGLTEETVTEKVDIWSLGCIMYELMTNTPLFNKLDDSDDMYENEKVVMAGLLQVHHFSTHSSGKTYDMSLLAMKCLYYFVDERISAEGILTELF
jgi:serine/threonine protein kinase